MTTTLIQRIEQLAGPFVAAQLRREYGGAMHYLPNPRPAPVADALVAERQARQAAELERLIAARKAAAAWEPRA